MRAKLTELLKTTFNEQYEKRHMITHQHTADYLIANGVVVQEWIPVSERLPNVDTKDSPRESVWVIVAIEGHKRSECRRYERARVRGKTSYRWKYPWDGISDEKITHWMPLPEPPKGDEANGDG